MLNIELLRKIVNRKTLAITFHSIIIFCVVSFLSVFYSIASRSGADYPVANIGFPFKYYSQFWVGNGYNKHGVRLWEILHGWMPNYFFIDVILVWILVCIIYYFLFYR
jgi:ABC-type antimicrobial peptide transport system permease subunit